MRLRIPATAVAVMLVALFTVSCVDPPDKEMQQARGALDTARAAGADEYAADEYKAAALALERSHEAVTQRDYRLALSQALESRERAQNAARLAADQKAVVGAEVERTLAALDTELDACAATLKAGQAVRVPAKALSPLQQTLPAARLSMQKARAAMGRHQYLAARAELEGLVDRVAKTQGELEAAIEARQGKPARR
jgi:hypothetical protein